MQPLVPIFMRHAAAASAEQDHGSQTEIAGRGHLTFEFRDNPFESLVRKVEKLIDRDPKEALRLLKMTISSKLFSAPRELERLSGKLDETLEKLREMRPQPALQNAALAPLLSAAFTRETFGLPPSLPAARPQPANFNWPPESTGAMPGADLSSLAA
jgi:hypothetical protein